MGVKQIPSGCYPHPAGYLTGKNGTCTSANCSNLPSHLYENKTWNWKIAYCGNCAPFILGSYPIPVNQSVEEDTEADLWE